MVFSHKKKKHLIVYFLTPEGIQGTPIEIVNMNVCYEACQSPDQRFVAICGREGGTAYLSDG